jgi:glycosyltransferase involved in cell wall biosynthesis
VTGPIARRPRIAIDARAATARGSGVGRYVVNLLAGLVEDDTLRPVALVPDDPDPALASLPGLAIVETGWDRTRLAAPARLAWEQDKLPRILARADARLHHATWNHGIPWRAPCPSVLTLHDLLPLTLPGAFGGRRQKLAFLASQGLALWRARRIIAVSHATRAALGGAWHPALARTQVIHEGVEPRFAPAPPGAAPEARDYLLHVGGREPRKNLATLFAAYGAAAPGLPLHLTGRADTLGPADQIALAALPARLRARVVFLGAVPDAALPALYRGARLLLFPSRGEGFGFPALEAMACGTPVIASRAGSLPELCGDAAWLVDPDDLGGLATAISALLADPFTAARLAVAGLARAALFPWHRCVAATRALYRDLLAEA